MRSQLFLYCSLVPVLSCPVGAVAQDLRLDPIVDELASYLVSSEDMGRLNDECRKMMEGNLRGSFCQVTCRDGHVDLSRNGECQDSKGNNTGWCCPSQDSIMCLPNGTFAGYVFETGAGCRTVTSETTLYVYTKNGNCTNSPAKKCEKFPKKSAVQPE